MRIAVFLFIAVSAFADERESLDARWIEANLRFALERKDKPVDKSIGVYLGRGASAPSGIAVVRRLDALKRPPRLLFERDFIESRLEGLKTLVCPGGWAPSIHRALTPKGIAELKAFVRKGGRYLGICAGGYLVCESVEWYGKKYRYPIGIAPGVAVGPLDDIAPWPQSAAVTIAFKAGAKGRALYAGGSSFRLEAGKVLAYYAGGKSPAIVDVHYGYGRMILTGAHPEFSEKTDADLLRGWADGVKCGDGSLFGRLLKRFDAMAKRR